MSYLFANQWATIYKKKTDSNGKPVLDRNGKTTTEKVIKLACSAKEGSYLVQSRSATGIVNDQTVIGTVQIKFNNLVDIQYTDEIEFINELSHRYINQPKEIKVKRIHGVPIITEVVI